MPKILAPTEFKSVPFKVTKLDIKGRTVEGYAAIFGIMDLKGDIIHPGAFKKTLQERGGRIRFLWQHDMDEPIGKPLLLREDTKGLFIRAVISDTARGRDVLALLQDEAIDEFSIGYDPMPGATTYERKGDVNIRHLKELRLWCFSLVTFAMHPDAKVTELKSASGEEVLEGSETSAPEEEKKVDVTENTIQVRVVDSSKFKKGSFRTIRIGKKSDGIQARIGRPEGKTATRIQAYIFDKTKWTRKEATDWVKEHKKSLDLTRLVDNARTAFHSQVDRSWEFVVGPVFEDHLIAARFDQESTTREYFKVSYIHNEKGEDIEVALPEDWVEVDLVYQETSTPKDKKQVELLLAHLKFRQESCKVMLGQVEESPTLVMN